jgi:hypothetical protein
VEPTIKVQSLICAYILFCIKKEGSRGTTIETGALYSRSIGYDGVNVEPKIKVQSLICVHFYFILY